MPLPSSSPDALARDPELASIEILASAADTARRALFAEYPELACGDVFLEQADVSARQCLVVALLTDIDTLADSISTYRAHLSSLESASLRRIRDDDF
jgi:hypothetical protein